MDIRDIADEVIKAVRSRGVAWEVIVCANEATSVSQRLLKHEETMYSKNCQIGVRVIVDGKRCSCISFNDLSKLSDLVDAAIAIASSMPEDPYISISDASGEYSQDISDMRLFDDSVIEVPRICEMLSGMEEAALSYDGKIVNSEGASFSRSNSEMVLATSNGFVGSYKRSRFSTSVSIVSSDGGKMEVDYSFSAKNYFGDLEKPEVLGRDAAARAVRRLNARDMKTCKVPVLFENRVASAFLGNFAAAISGSAIADKTSFLIDGMNGNIFRSGIHIVDDPLMPGGLSTRPFDGEGVGSRKNVVVEDGVLRSWLLDMRTAKQLGLSTTGNAVRCSNASVSPGVSNFYINGTDVSPEVLMSDIKEGVYVTDLFGSGVNLTTGDYSQGAFGFMIENGKVTHPVHGITVAGNLRHMFAGMRAANDLSFLRSVNAPTLRFDDMVVSGVS
ncbi:peptidase pmbA [Anaplasma centrale str. Israel]|uniref:Peptidase pmbA n=1 Tax=Anaplasma centrale (strain Israel) TaxID=574556 RepID=D1AUN9_ANACI|nr:TldD/PmbA family protein [Anaplasma centrale]ACZ49267.1 peptidase pmbA [Anaplasma centrale str. Israel]